MDVSRGILPVETHIQSIRVHSGQQNPLHNFLNCSGFRFLCWGFWRHVEELCWGSFYMSHHVPLLCLPLCPHLTSILDPFVLPSINPPVNVFPVFTSIPTLILSRFFPAITLDINLIAISIMFFFFKHKFYMLEKIVKEQHPSSEG